MSICPQNGFLFNDSILNNIKFGRTDASNEEVEEVSKITNIYDRIMKIEDGFNANVGTLGSKLSGGEKQRLLLARSILKRGDIILLDEPTSNLDSYNEKIVMDYFTKERGTKTILIAAHK